MAAPAGLAQGRFELLGVMDGVQHGSREWVANAKSATWLAHTTDRLQAAERLLKRADLAASLAPTDRDYLAACREAECTAQENERSTVRTGNDCAQSLVC